MSDRTKASISASGVDLFLALADPVRIQNTARARGFRRSIFEADLSEHVSLG